MSNKKNKNKLDIIQGQSPLYVLFLNNNEGCTKMHVEDVAISVKEIFPSFFSSRYCYPWCACYESNCSSKDL